MCAKNTNLFVKKKNDRRNSICFIRYFRPNTSAFETQTLYQHQSALPYMDCCTLPRSSTKEPMILGPMPQSRWKKTWMYCPCWWLVMVDSEDEVWPANYIKFNYYQLSQLKLNNATRERIMQLLRWTVFRIAQTNFKKNWKETVKYRPAWISTLV